MVMRKILIYLISIAVLGSCTKNLEEHNHSKQHIHSHELAEDMLRMQIYMNKLYFSGKNENQELTDFYVHEIEEIMEKIIKQKVKYEGINIADYMGKIGLQQLERFEKGLDLKDSASYEKCYTAFVNACNACHTVSKHAYIKIKVPDSPVLNNQEY